MHITQTVDIIVSTKSFFFFYFAFGAESCSPAASPSVLGAPVIELFLILLRESLNLFPISVFSMEILVLHCFICLWK